MTAHGQILALLIAAVGIAPISTDAQIILPAVQTSWGDTVSVTVLTRLAFKPERRLPDADKWQVRILAITKKAFGLWKVDVGAPADTCVEFPAYVFSFSPPTVDGRVLVSLTPGEGWLAMDSEGRLIPTHYFAIIEQRIAGEPSGSWQPLKIRRSAIPSYLAYGTELTILPKDDTKRQYIIGKGGAAPPDLRVPCVTVTVRQLAGEPTPVLLACAPSAQDEGRYAQ